jgi:hypothetical protein
LITLSHQDSILKSQKVKNIGVTYTGSFSLLRQTVLTRLFFPLFFFTKFFHGSETYCRLLRSQPLDIVFNPIIIKILSEFFKIPEDVNQSSHLSDKIRAAAFNR